MNSREDVRRGAAVTARCSWSVRTHHRVLLLLAVVLVVGWVPAVAGEVPAGGREEVEVRLVQVPFVVVDPRSGSRGSVRGITLEDLRVRIDGEEVPRERLAGFHLDEVCGPGSAPPAEAGRPSGRLLVLVADFNYLDTRGRELVARALEALADRLEREGAGSWRYKVYGITREVVPLTAGATADPADLRLAAERVRDEAWAWALVRPGEVEGPDVPAEIEFLAKGPVAEFRRMADRIGTRFRRSLAEPPHGAMPSLFGGDNAERDRDAAEASGRELGRWADGEVDRAMSGMFDLWADARQRFRPAASLAALRAILLANGDWPGWKGLVLYTSEGFRYADEERQRMLMDRVLATARGSFVLWTVDAGGLARAPRPGGGGAAEQSALPTSLLSSLARDTGGEVLRRTGDLSLAWKGLAERLSCYYLLSIPVEGEQGKAGKELAVDVRLDTARRKELWGLRVEQPGKVLVESPRARLLRRRVAALLNPADFPRPRVRVEAGLPAGGELPVRVRVRLADLSWERFRGEGGGVIARLLVDAVGERVGRASQEVACRLEGGRDGRLVAWLPRPPRPNDTRELAIEFPCAAGGEGLVRLRAAVTDLVGGEIGGALGIAALPGKESGGGDLRVLAVSGRDLAWRPGEKVARPDRDRRAWRLVLGDSVGTGDRLRLAWRAPAEDWRRVRLAVLRLRGEEEAPEVALVLPPDRVTLVGEGPAAVARIDLPEYSLEPGRYLFVLLDPAADPAGWAADFAAGRADEGTLRAGALLEVR